MAETVIDTNGDADGRQLGSITLRFDLARDGDDDIAVRQVTLVDSGMTTEHIREVVDERVYLASFDFEDIIPEAVRIVQREREGRH